MLFRFMATAAAALSLLAGSALAAPNLEETMAAASRGDPAAANRIGVWYEKGQNGLLRNHEKAVEWYRKAAQSGSVLAMHNLGDCYLNRVGVEFSPAKAYAWYKAAAEHGGAIGYEDIGKFFLKHGFGRPDRETAMVWLAAAAKQGRTKAQEQLLALGGSRQPAGSAFPPCPQRRLGQDSVSGRLEGVLPYGPEDAGDKLISLKDSSGRAVEVLAVLGTGGGAELAEAGGSSASRLRGRNVTLDYASVQALDDYTAQCRAQKRYVPGSLREGGKPAAQARRAPMAREVLIGCEGLLLGAWAEGQWIDVEKLQKEEHWWQQRAMPGKEGALYTARGHVADCTMGMLATEDPEKQERGSPMDEFPFFPMLTPSGKYEGDPGLFVGGLGGGFNAMPRKARQVRDGLSRYEAMVARHLASKGLPGARVRIECVHAVDLDGDGVDEHIVCAQDFLRGNGDAPMNSFKKRGMYSVILLERSVNGQTATVPVESWVSTENANVDRPSQDDLWSRNALLLCADVNGDGVMEIIVSSSFYEGVSYEVFTLTDKGVRKVLEGGYGV